MAMFFRFTLATAVISLSLTAPGLAQEEAAKLYKANCAMCHSANGSGDSVAGKALKAKDLRSPEVQSQTDAALLEVISKGKNKMPAFGEKIEAGDIKKLVAYLRELAKKK
jgi:mono/diheme cytochrome c family protein